MRSCVYLCVRWLLGCVLAGFRLVLGEGQQGAEAVEEDEWKRGRNQQATSGDGDGGGRLDSLRVQSAVESRFCLPGGKSAAFLSVFSRRESSCAVWPWKSVDESCPVFCQQNDINSDATFEFPPPLLLKQKKKNKKPVRLDFETETVDLFERKTLFDN